MLNSNIIKYIFLAALVFFALFLLLESALLPVAFLLLTIFLILIVKYPKHGILLLFLIKPLLDATYFYQIPVIGLNFLQITGVMFPIFTILILVSLKTDLSQYQLSRIIILLIITTVFSFITYLLNYIHFSGSRLIGFFISGLVILFQFSNGLCSYFLLPRLFQSESDKKLFFKIMILASLFPLLTAYLQIGGFFEGRTIRTTGELMRLTGLYHDSSNLRFYSFQSIVVVLIYLQLYGRKTGLAYRLLLFSLIPLFILIIYLGYSKAAVGILLAWSCIYILISRNYILGGLILGLFVTSYLFVPKVSTEIDKLFYKEIMYYEGTLSEELEYTMLGGRFVRWDIYIDRFFRGDLLEQLFGYRFTIGIRAHNDFLRILISNGYIGIFLYTLFILSIMLKVFKSYLQYKDGIALGAVLLLISFLIDSIGLTPSIYTGYSWIVFGVISLSINRNIIPEKKE